METITQSTKELSEKSPSTLVFLCLFLGVFGAHRFYVKKFGTGLLMLLTLGGCGLWVLIDLILIALNKFDDKSGKSIQIYDNPSCFKKGLSVIGALIYGVFIILLVLMSIIMYASSGLVHILKEELSSLHSGDVEKAYSFNSKAFKAATSLEQFKEFVTKYPVLTHNDHVSITNRNVQYNNGVSTGSVEASLLSKDELSTSVIYSFIKENDAWKIQGIEINPAKSSLTPLEHPGLSQFYEDKNAGYSINYPKTWSERKPGKGKLVIGDTLGESSIYIDPLLSKKGGGVYENKKAVNDDYIGQFKGLAPDFTIVETGTFDLPKNPKNIHGEYFTATYTYKGETLKRSQYVFDGADDQVFYVWAFVTSKDKFTQDSVISKEILNTFDIKKIEKN